MHPSLKLAPCAGGCGTHTPWAFCRCCWKALPADLRGAVSAAKPGDRSEAIAQAAVHLHFAAGTPVVLPTVPVPDPVSGVVTWRGGVQVMGPLLRIPGRTLDVDMLDEAEQHAAAVLAAVAYMRRQANEEGR